ncbi:MAG TPA: tRNA (adenosine(37)-N6)-dimethylallyltransferase MiaA, partial [Chitinophagaceae bacterium]|nr:tRNA (adenosine(37)-N6)-dimethylallyltransferase MiaA [Chitinophagaceae bacterium]
QCFKELNIGVARPSAKELETIKHHFIASNSIRDPINAGFFEQFAIQTLTGLFQNHEVVIVVGGTGLYIKALCEGMDTIPEVPNDIRGLIISEYEKKGLPWLQNEIEKKDPLFYKVGEIHNPHRIMRALEVVEATGISILDFRKGKKETRNFNIVKIGLELPREALHRNINNRVDNMIGMGLVEEVTALLPYKNLNALQTVGYSELFDYLEGKISLDHAIELIRKNTRQYAKRQMTWFKKDKDITWLNAGSEHMASLILNHI